MYFIQQTIMTTRMSKTVTVWSLVIPQSPRSNNSLGRLYTVIVCVKSLSSFIMTRADITMIDEKDMARSSDFD